MEYVMDVIDLATSPANMSKSEAHDFLVELRDQINGRIEALRDEIGD